MASEELRDDVLDDDQVEPDVAVEDDPPPDDATWESPLWMVTTESKLNQFVIDLQRMRASFGQPDAGEHELPFSKAMLAEVRASFAHMIRHGEESLHRLSQLLCETFFASYQIQSVVIAEVETTRDRFTLTQALSVDDLYSTLDIDLGSRQLEKLQYYDGSAWVRPSLVANVVDYQPGEPNSYGIHHVTTRIKAEEEIWNKVVDEIFGLDALVQQDKKLRHLSRYVKDVFGIKIVVGALADVPKVQKALEALHWTDDQLESLEITPGDDTRRLRFVEVKDYLSPGQRKRSGWEAMKSVVTWCDKTFEIQVQPLRTFLREREVLTRESHLSFKARREQVRNQVAEQIPLFRFYRDLLRWLFRNPTGPPPTHPGVRVRVVE
jgi:ppGpp synthetase/RelA/SpoT-type nucleotidyltranferase